MKSMILLTLVALAAFSLPAEVSVSDITCTPRFPWNGKVDIDYTVGSDNPNEEVRVWATAFDEDANVPLKVSTLTGEGAQQPVKPGRHRLTWDAAADHPGFVSTALRVDLTVVSGRPPLYMVIDLSGGAEAGSYPVLSLESVPQGGWTDEYKTTKLVLRRILPGTFTMGSPTTELGHDWTGSGRETLHQVTLTEPFYIGVFEVTQRQWELVMGSNPSARKGNGRPVESVSYNDIRGSNLGARWPADDQVDVTSFMGKLREKALLTFDLPTEAQWEYACRAGTQTALNSGKDLTNTQTCPNMDEVGCYGGTSGSACGGYSNGPDTVGSYLPNAWGLYDMHGNVAEWCRDWCNLSMPNASVVDPAGPTSSGWGRNLRGGSWDLSDRPSGYAAGCRSAHRGLVDRPDKRVGSVGFRAYCRCLGE